MIEHHAEILVARGGVVPRRPVDQHRRILAEEREHALDHRLVRAPHALRVDHGLRRAGRAGGKQKLDDGVRPDSCVRLVERARRRRLRQLRDHLDARATSGDRLREGRAIRGVHQPRGEQRKDRPQLAEVGGKQRIGRRYRRIGDAGIHRPEVQQPMLDVIAREHDQRPLGRQAVGEQRRADAPRLVQRIAV